LRHLPRLPPGQPFDLKNRKRQNRNRNGLVGERKIQRSLVEQRENPERRL
jgi:hypothetical protein